MQRAVVVIWHDGERMYDTLVHAEGTCADADRFYEVANMAIALHAIELEGRREA